MLSQAYASLYEPATGEIAYDTRLTDMADYKAHVHLPLIPWRLPLSVLTPPAQKRSMQVELKRLSHCIWLRFRNCVGLPRTILYDDADWRRCSGYLTKQIFWYVLCTDFAIASSLALYSTTAQVDGAKLCVPRDHYTSFATDSTIAYAIAPYSTTAQIAAEFLEQLLLSIHGCRNPISQCRQKWQNHTSSNTICTNWFVWWEYLNNK